MTKEIEKEMAHFDSFFESWEVKPYSCSKWANAKSRSALEFYNTVCIFSNFNTSQAFQRWLISHQA